MRLQYCGARNQRERFQMAQQKISDTPAPETVVTRIVSTFDNELGKFLGDGMAKGYRLLCPPVFTHQGEPRGMNDYAVGFNHPHFLIVLVKS
jgi:hypothetical protein